MPRSGRQSKSRSPPPLSTQKMPLSGSALSTTPFKATLRRRNSPLGGRGDGRAISPSGSTNLSCLSAGAAEKVDQLLRRTSKAEQYVRQKLTDAWACCHFQHLPAWLQDNDYLHRCHRPPLKSFRACLMSVFRFHTETLNIWTHAIGCMIFTWLAIYVLKLEGPAPGALALEDKLAFGAFFAGAIICLGMSTLYHTFSCHSQRVGKIFSKLDYCGIALLIAGSFVPWLYYGFYCEYRPKLFYLVLVSTLGALTIMVSWWERFSEPNLRPLRAGVFMSFGLSGVIPGVHWVLSQDWYNSTPLRVALLCLVTMGLLYISGAILYALRIPECFFPGQCDVWFHSHQLFHILVILAAIVHYHGISEMALYRLSNPNFCHVHGSQSSTIGTVLMAH